MVNEVQVFSGPSTPWNAAIMATDLDNEDEGESLGMTGR